MGVLTFPKFHCWDNARRSPNYVYNQIKVTSDCGSGSYPTHGLDLIKNQGDCSWLLMPYVNGDCATQPNTVQRADASQNKAVNWAALDINDVDRVKLALDLGFPVVSAFRVTPQFDQMGVNGGIWSTNGPTTINRGGHATCIVGYDDIRQQFKVQNQWGNFWGDNGYYWVTYDLVRQNCYEGLYIVYGNNGSTTLDINGPASICLPTTSATYNISNLACNTSVI
jgi:C1A family cysteine protease